MNRKDGRRPRNSASSGTAASRPSQTRPGAPRAPSATGSLAGAATPSGRSRPKRNRQRNPTPTNRVQRAQQKLRQHPVHEGGPSFDSPHRSPYSCGRNICACQQQQARKTTDARHPAKLDIQLHLGSDLRPAPRHLRPRQIPGHDTPHDCAPAARRCSLAEQVEGLGREK